MNKEKNVIIKEGSLLAQIAAKKLKEKSVAIVIGRTIYLHGISNLEFAKNERWLRHEMAHVNQFKQHGLLPFILKYLVESLRKGYHNNKYEVEARAAEKPDQ